jgi:Tfp pilus assembly protein PilF
MRRALLLLLLAALLAGCQTDRRGVQVDLGAVARAYKQRLDRQPSREQVERMVASLPAEQLNDMGVLYEREGRLDRAAWAYQQAIWRNPRFALAYVNLGNVLRQQGQTEDALFRYRQAMSADRNNFEAANNFADLCAEKGVHLDEAIGRLRTRLDAAGPHRAYGLDTLGWLYHQTGDEAAAAETLETALREPAAKDPRLRSLIEQHLAAVNQAREKAKQ